MQETHTHGIYQRLIRIGSELAELRREFLKLHPAELSKHHPGSLRGIWTGVTIDETDLAEAKVSLFPESEV